MSIVSELVAMPGVIAAGEYTYRGDRFSYEGDLDHEMARMASIMCRATTMGVHMQAEIMGSFAKDCGCTPSRGWVVRGSQLSVCVIANVFCFIDHNVASANEVMRRMSAGIKDQAGALI